MNETRRLAGKASDAVDRAVERLMDARVPAGYWPGRLSSSAVSTAVATLALAAAGTAKDGEAVRGGKAWLAKNQNADGGWGDTDRSPSNRPATVLAAAALAFDGTPEDPAVLRARAYLDARGGLEAVADEYGEDRTFSAPILAVAALAGLTPWSAVPELPYEVVLLPRRVFHMLGLPVVSYALPALCAVGMLINARRGGKSPVRWLRKTVDPHALRTLERLQPTSGGYLEAAPLTGFVAASLAGTGRDDHPVVNAALGFLRRSRRPDGSWPIDENLSVWNTALALQALDTAGLDVRSRTFGNVRRWYRARQTTHRHVFTHSPPGGFPWTHLPGGVPDADDTGLALSTLRRLGAPPDDPAVRRAAEWCRRIQNRDGGWPTFCRGWGTLPFDRSAVGVTAHVLGGLLDAGWNPRTSPIRRAIRWIAARQTKDGSWRPLWFGNEKHPRRENPTYAVSQILPVLARLSDDPLAASAFERGRAWLLRHADDSGGWGPEKPVEPSPEETAFAVSALLETGTSPETPHILRGIRYLLEQQLPDGSWRATPIGLYFAQLWYYEELYAVTFPLRALALWLRKIREVS